MHGNKAKWTLWIGLSLGTNTFRLFADPSLEMSWPLEAGTTWTYNAEVTYMGEKDPKTLIPPEVTQKFQFQCKVLDSFVSPSYKAALVHGAPEDVSWTNDPKYLKDRIVIQMGIDYYELKTDDADQVFDKLKKAGQQTHLVIDDLNKMKLLMPFPLAVDKRFGPEQDIPNFITGRYSWVVEGCNPFIVSDSIKGCPKDLKSTEYAMAYRTAPDHTLLGFVPGLGITYYEYHHHGTPEDVTISLVEFHAPMPPK